MTKIPYLNPTNPIEFSVNGTLFCVLEYMSEAKFDTLTEDLKVDIINKCGRPIAYLHAYSAKQVQTNESVTIVEFGLVDPIIGLLH